MLNVASARPGGAHAGARDVLGSERVVAARDEAARRKLGRLARPPGLRRLTVGDAHQPVAPLEGPSHLGIGGVESRSRGPASDGRGAGVRVLPADRLFAEHRDSVHLALDLVDHGADC